MTALRVLHCPANVGGHPSELARAERSLGLHSRAVALADSPFGYEIDEIVWKPDDGLLRREALRYRLLWTALRRFDVIHFNFGQSILPNRLTALANADGAAAKLRRRASELYIDGLNLRDLPLLKAAGKTIAITYQGDDARQGSALRELFELSPLAGVEPGYYTADSDARKRATIERFARYADRIYALNPDLLHVLPTQAQFMPYAHVDPRKWAAVPHPRGRVPVVAHAPTHRGAKGTPAILDACAQLRAEGVRFELDLIEGVSRVQARARYERADLVVDQLLAGWYGGVAVEVMALARPAIAYLREGDLRFLPEQMRTELPVINATPTTIADVLRSWLTDRRDELAELGARSRRYVERWHDPVQIARRLKDDYGAPRR